MWLSFVYNLNSNIIRNANHPKKYESILTKFE